MQRSYKTAIFPGICRTTSAVSPGRSSCGDALCCLWRHRRNLAIRWIDNQPGLCSFGHCEIGLPPFRWRGQPRLKVLNGALLRVALNLEQLVALDVLQLPALKNLRALKRGSIFAEIRKRTLQVGITPRRARRDPSLSQWQQAPAFEPGPKGWS